MTTDRPFKLERKPIPLADLQSGVDRAPPHSLDSESGYLSGLLCEPGIRLDDATANIPPDVFYSEPNREFYITLLSMWKNEIPIDIATVTHRCRELQIIDKIGGPGMISQLFSFRPVGAHFDFFQKVILDKWLLREQLRASLTAVHRCYQHGKGTEDVDVNDVLDECESLTRAVRDRSHAGRIQTISELCLAAQDSFEAQIVAASNLTLDADGRAPIPGLTTGITALDDMTLGLCEGHPWMIMAGTSDGKTALAEQISLFRAVESSDPVPVCYYLMESSPNDWLKRGWSYLSGVSLSSILRGTVIPAEAEKVGAAITRMSGSPLHLRHVPGLTDVALEADMRFMHRKHGIRLFVVDYIQRVRITQRGYGQNDADALSDFSQKIADQTSRMKATTLILSQLNDEGKIAKSKAMAWDSEIAFTMSRPLKDGQKDSIHGGKVFRGERVENSRELMFHKTRMTGERGNKLLLSFDGDRQRFR